MRKTPANEEIETCAVRTPDRLFVSFTSLPRIIMKKAEIPPSTMARKPKISPIVVGASTVPRSLHMVERDLLD